MNLRWSATFRQILLSLIFSLSFVVATHPSSVLAEELSAEEMVVALTEKGPVEPGKNAARMRGMGFNKAAMSARQLQLALKFDTGAASISTESRDVLTRLGTAMNSPTLLAQSFRIEGHTDATGDTQTNQQLSTRRAQNVQDFLEKNGGVASARLTAIGKGSSEPVDAADPKAAVNRRVVIAAVENVEPAQATAAPAKPDVPVSTVQVAVPNANAAAGTVKQVRGDVSLARANVSSKIVEGQTLNEGDTISTAADASVMVQLSDDAKLLVRGNSTVRLTRIINNGAVEKRSQSIELALGALRYVTGALGKLRPESVSFKTPVATVGIRGTDLDIVHTAATRGLQAAGTYVRVNTGEVELNGNDGSQVALSKDEQAVATRLGPPLRGGGRGPATKKLEVPASVFTASELDTLLEINGR
jgi:outer membrane protein OmpA-like peptidoglycan-associated protein